MVDNEPDLTNWHFDPAELTVPAGSTVVWHNRGHEDHSVTADDKSFDSGLKKPGTDFQRVFPRLGRFSYHCTPHPWMIGVIQVVAATTPTTTLSATTTTTTTRAAAAAGTAPTTPAPASGTGTPAQPGGSGATTTTFADVTTPSAAPGAADGSASPATNRAASKHGLLGTLALVLIPTLGALAVAARMRRPKS
jgi:hypothetical protein